MVEVCIDVEVLAIVVIVAGVDVVVASVGAVDLNRAARDALSSIFWKYLVIFAAGGTWKGGSWMLPGVGRLWWLPPTLSIS